MRPNYSAFRACSLEAKSKDHIAHLAKMRKPSLIILIATSCLILALAHTCLADDTSMDGESGAIYPMHKDPTIRMVSEVVRIKLPEGRVDGV